MPVWILLAALATVVITGALTLILARLNPPQGTAGNRRTRDSALLADGAEKADGGDADGGD